ncbi:MAG: RNB domain-containing ribonuclease [Hydrogenophaga sp.]|jgi:exoribonuclease-2|uniref:ribonuclease catalytic domain-containing protein n=1 Tax=Hydrogenophaga sp. TaxID=1904254 RepID=UPI00271D1390|nr:ribonuclease catalytic domain-containing protein [Hydrogenophaga sp.]MDO9568165.1 RNB domain-containing ribonuclease [Hydrogenophaga sp.]MDP1894856.1 RNB domain-containing ribonuclease [Hydrogenophaga sp.]MDP3373253.1 RNB domain-containing ribonuclease [Hydrogenophaga sp.]MDZ4239860.1 ribonuclease catalytic domain-containing protein [Hydrogenophaga sp.]
MHILFDEAGKLLTGRLLSEAESSLQVELDTGKRVKVKAANALLRFEKPAPAQLMPAATALAESMELEMAYEFAPEDEFGFADLAREYFSASAGTEQQVAALLCLHGSPHYFRRAGKGRYKKAPADILAQALAAIEKKKQVQAQIEAWAAELANGQCPEPVRQQLYKILFKPDKNAPEYKAVVEAARNSHTAPLALLQNAGAISSAYQFHWQRFLFDQFPKGTGFPALQAPVIADDLPLAPVQAFSIDDSHTTEIDDALSIQGLGTGTVTLGIHIAAPGLVVLPDGPIDQVARNRLSTVYMPGHKITMLPDEVVQAYTLEAGRDCPALSLYVTLDEATLTIQDRRTALERVPIAHNLRHDKLDTVITEEWLNGAAPASEALVEAHIEALQPQLAFIFRLARHLKAQREVVRGKPENFSRPDYTFRLEGVSGSEPAGHETVVIGTRQRGAPLDLMVAEAMILANSSWGQWLAECGVPGIYRSQASLQPGVKVRMGTKAQPHAGIGVPSYAWSTSPLRRYVDMVNQWQIIACVRHGKTAALAAPFKPKDAQLFAVISAFDAAYTAYNGFQNGMERYWTLQYLKQNNIGELTATLFKDNLVRADNLPLVLPVMGADGLPRGAHVRVRLGAVDDITLDIHGTVVERLDLPGEDLADDSSDSGEDDEALAAPLALAIDVDDAGTPAEATTTENAV